MSWVVTEGETPIDPEESGALKKRSIRTQVDLNMAEAMSIARAELGISFEDRHRTLELDWLLSLHRRMFGEVWTWAGQLRKTQRNIGVDFTQVRIQLIQLIENSKQQLVSEVDRESIATYFHHGLLFVHPFPNGNGRWARRVTETQSDGFSIRPPRWISLVPDQVPDFRRNYLQALRQGDEGNLAPLQQLIFTD